jgi:hypothetical protein
MAVERYAHTFAQMTGNDYNQAHRFSIIAPTAMAKHIKKKPTEATFYETTLA